MRLEEMAAAIEKLPAHEQKEFMDMLAQYEQSVTRERAQTDFMAYVHEMWPGFISGRHHKVMAKKFQEIAEGKLKRLIINMPPRHTKSEFASYLLPSWFLGKYPGKKIIQCSNTAELAVGFGRKVRNLVGSEQYAKIFPNVSLRADSKAAGRWSTSHNGEYFAIGVGGTVTGKGADLLIIDDPHSEQEAKLAMSNSEVFDSVYEWYTSGPRQRLQPGGSIIIVMCMTGDTPVLMANGVEKPLRDVREGDYVATFDKGVLTTSRVNGWKSNGVDTVYKVQTQSGKILRANERHPFLVENNGVLEWTRLKHLQTGDLLVSLKDVAARQGLKQSQESVERACQETATTEKIQTPRYILLDTTGNGKEKSAQNLVAKSQSTVTAFALRTITKIIGHLVAEGSHRKNAENTVLKAVTVLLQSSMMPWLRSVETDVMYAVSRQQKKILVPIGMGNCASTTAMAQAGYEDYFVTTATSLSGTPKQRKSQSQLHLISDFTTDQIVSITIDGQEEVFDVEIEKTENFIANGIVSHNTRWSKKDLTGRVLQSMIDRDGEKWEVIDFPAILPSGNLLWPEFWSYEEINALRVELPVSKWNAHYQQQPTSEEGALIKREWCKMWVGQTPPPCEFIIQSWDTAFTKNERSDYSACTTWGVFYLNEDQDDANIILLDAVKKRMEFPELKAAAMQYYKEWEPDACIVEAKAAGAPLVFELRKAGVPVSEYTPSRGNDKIARVNSVTDLFSSGKVWAPKTRWAEEVIEEMAAFPNSDHDDLVDSATQALIRFRKGGFIKLQTDEEDEPLYRRKASYY